MKQIINNTLIFLITVIITGCYDLDRAPADKVSSSTFWITEEHCVQGMMGVYHSLKQYDLYGKQFLYEVNSDIMTGFGGYDALMLGTCTPSTSLISKKWQNTYNAIWRANGAIQNITIADIDQEVKDVMIAELKFLRALFYFHLNVYFGGVPLYDETTVLEDEFANLMNPRATDEEVKAFILKDIDMSKDILPVKWDKANQGRATKGAAYALRGKVNLYAKDWTSSIADFEEMLKPEYGYELGSDFKSLFTLEGHRGAEMIFSIQNISLSGVSWPELYGMAYSQYLGTYSTFGNGFTNAVPATRFIDMFEYKDGRKFNWDELFPGFSNEDNKVKHETFYALFNDEGTKIEEYPESRDKILEMYEQRDPRLSETVILPFTTIDGWVSNAPKVGELVWGKNAKGDQINPNQNYGFIPNKSVGRRTAITRKFTTEGNMDGKIWGRMHSPINYPLIRLADVYLMVAEAYNENGEVAKAVEFINKVRARPSVGMALINSGPAHLQASTKEEVFKRIFNERAYELAIEGHREIDLRRWRLSHELLDGKTDRNITGEGIANRVFNKDRDYLWPIPDTEIEINKSLKQNPGW